MTQRFFPSSFLRRRAAQVLHTHFAPPALSRWRAFVLTIGAIFLLIATGACDKLPRNGRLDGQWQLMERDGTSVRGERTYWAFQLDLLQLRSFTAVPLTQVKHSGGVVLRFDHRGDSLILTKGYLMNRDQQQDILIDSTHQADLSAFGIPQLPMRYGVQRLDAEQMVLTSGAHRWVFRKF